jgi:ATP-binding cassette subfamily B protein
MRTCGDASNSKRRSRVRDDAHDEILGRGYDHRLAWRLWGAARPHRRLIMGSTLLFPFVAAVELTQPYLLKIAIDDHILRADWRGLGVVAALFVGTLLALYVLRSVESYVMNLTGQRVMHDLRAALFNHLIRMDARFFDGNPVGRLMTRVLHDAEAVSEAFTSGLFAVVADAITLVGVVGVMLWMDWRLALVTFGIVPAVAAVAAYFRVRARDAYRVVRQRLARLNAFLQESLQGMTVIQLFARAREERRGFQALNDVYRRALFGSTVFEASLYASVEALGSVALAALIWHGGRQIVAETLTFGALVAFIQYTSRFFLPIRDLGAKYAVMQAAMIGAERIFGLLDLPPTIVSPPRARVPVRGAGTAALAFEGVWFAYDTGHWVLQDCSFAVCPGERVAIVGATGEGKSTCARLVNRSYDVARGRILVDDVDVREWDLHRLRRHVGVIFQESVLFTRTVEANLRLGVDGAVSRAELERAATVANVRDFIETLPGGWLTELAERGANVSHGQRQLLAIARALVYNPLVLILDEATSSIDPESEARIQVAMNRLLADRTSVTIAHRLSTIQGADRILVLHRGRIHEEGTHAELLRQGGLYARFHELGLGEQGSGGAAPARARA